MQAVADTLRYRVDRDNVVVWVDAHWSDFAADNDAGPACLPDAVVGAPLESFISDPGTWSLYEGLLERVRRSGCTARFQIRCDSPGERRWVRMEVAPADDEQVDFTSAVTRTERRDPEPLLDRDAPRSDGPVLKLCSFCKRVEMGPEDWVEIEEAMVRLDLHCQDVLPRVSHGLCPDCYRRIVALT